MGVKKRKRRALPKSGRYCKSDSTVEGKNVGCDVVKVVLLTFVEFVWNERRMTSTKNRSDARWSYPVLKTNQKSFLVETK